MLPWCPSFSLAVRILLLVRFFAAMHSNIQDADEGTLCNLQLETHAHVFPVFNFWESLISVAVMASGNGRPDRDMRFKVTFILPYTSFR